MSPRDRVLVRTPSSDLATTPAEKALSHKLLFVVRMGMRPVIQARLDDRSRKKLSALVRELGWTPSRIVRQGLRVLETI